jgi:hypothetical protein
MKLNCSQVKTLVRTTSMQMSFPETASDSLGGYSLVEQTHSFISCPGGWSQTIPEVKKRDVEVLGWRGYMWSVVLRPVGLTAKFSKTTLEVAYAIEINIKLAGDISGGHSCSQHANSTLPPRTCGICGIVLCDTTAHFREAFYCPQHKVHLCNDHAV